MTSAPVRRPAEGSPAGPVGATTTGFLASLFDARNDEAWRALDERHRPVLLAFARRMGLDEHEAADIVQDTLATFAVEYREGRYDRDRGRLRTWLFSMVRVRVLKAFRRLGRESDRRGLSAIVDACDDDSMSRAWDREWRAARLREGLVALRERTRTDPRTLLAFERLTLAGQSATDVADSLGMTVESVYVAKHRTMARLRGILAELEGEL